MYIGTHTLTDTGESSNSISWLTSKCGEARTELTVLLRPLPAAGGDTVPTDLVYSSRLYLYYAEVSKV
jgi:hypothetical protein